MKFILNVGSETRFNEFIYSLVLIFEIAINHFVRLFIFLIGIISSWIIIHLLWFILTHIFIIIIVLYVQMMPLSYFLSYRSIIYLLFFVLLKIWIRSKFFIYRFDLNVFPVILEIRILRFTFCYTFAFHRRILKSRILILFNLTFAEDRGIRPV